MRKREIEAKLREEADRFVPDGRNEIKRRVVFSVAEKKESRAAARRKWYFAAAPIAAVLIIAIALTFALLPNAGSGGGGDGGGGFEPTPFTESVVRVDINPSVKFSVGRESKVTKQYACNKDGAILLMKQNFVGLEITAATAGVVGLASKLGYLGHGKKVRLRVLNDNTELESDLMQKLDLCVTNRLEALSISADVEARGKNDVVEYLVEQLGYERPFAEKLSAEDLEEILEDAWDEDRVNLDKFQEEISGGIEIFLKRYTESSKKIISILREAKPNGNHYELSDEQQTALSDFCLKFYSEAEIGISSQIEKHDFEELIKEIEEIEEDAREAILELDEDPDELSDVLEDFYDRYKIYLKNDTESLDTSFRQ